MAAGLMTPVMAPAFTPASNSNYSTPFLNGYYRSATSSMYSNHTISHHGKPLTPIKEMSSRLGNSKGILNESNNDSTTMEDNGCCQKLEPSKLCKGENIYATPFYRQLGILLLRTFLILWRDKALTTLRFVIHLVTALLIGCIYYGIGNDADNALNNFRYCFYSVMFIMYSAFSSILVKCKYKIKTLVEFLCRYT